MAKPTARSATGRLAVLFEDDWLVAVDKPAGLLSVGFPGNRAKTAEDILADRYRGKAKVRVFAVHRLDRDTSGVMIFAKSAESRDRFMDGWQEIVHERTYRCVCARTPRAAPLPDSLTVDEPIAYNVKDVGYVPKKDDKKAREGAERAVTRLRVLERGASLDLVECELETGRKNQIRVHLSHLGHPILGDPVYGEGARRRDEVRAGHGRAPDRSDPGRLALHARVLAFTHPFTGDQARFEVPEPKEFSRVVKARAARAEAEPRAPKTESARKPIASAKWPGSPKPARKLKGVERAGEKVSQRSGQSSGTQADSQKAEARSRGVNPAAQAETGKATSGGRYANGSKFIPGKIKG